MHLRHLHLLWVYLGMKLKVNGNIMATKLVSNEFVAMTDLAQGNFNFSDRTTAIISVFLVSFANFNWNYCRQLRA